MRLAPRRRRVEALHELALVLAQPAAGPARAAEHQAGRRRGEPELRVRLERVRDDLLVLACAEGRATRLLHRQSLRPGFGVYLILVLVWASPGLSVQVE